MLRGIFDIGAWEVETWERPREADVASRDSLLVDCRPCGLRLAVIDGVTPTDVTPGYAGVDGGMWAAATARSALLGRVTLEACALAAHAALRGIGPVSSPRDRPQASFVAVDLAGERAEALRGGDCELWVQQDGGWTRSFPREIDTPQERERMERWTRENPGRPFVEYDRARPESDDIWTSTALGRLPHPRLQAETFTGIGALVLATDGARLHADALRALEEWLDRIEQHQSDRPVSAWEGGADDVAVIRARRRP